MLDVMLFYLMAVALALAPADEKTFSLDLIQTNHPQVDTIRVERTEDGFTLHAPGGEPPLHVKRTGKDFSFKLPSNGDKPVDVTVDFTALSWKEKPVQIVTIKETEVYVGREGAYVFIKDEHRMVVRHSEPKAAKGDKEKDVRRGKLVYKDAPQIKSVEAYMHSDFTLEVEGGLPVRLSPSKAVSHEELKKLAGKNVEVTLVKVAAKPPSKGESYPMGPDGKPLERPAHYEVQAIKVLE